MSHSEHLAAKKPLILVTNRCNLSCGGCNQLCPNFKPEQRWSIPVDQLRQDIETLAGFYSDVEIFGGEPTIHPEWNAIKEVLRSFPDVKFRVFTNLLHRKGHLPDPEDNVYYHCDNDMRSWGYYLPALVAPIDVYKVQDKGFYWEMAQNHCWMWRDECSGILYDDRAYMCQPAGAFERITGTDFGWPFVPGENPFLRSDEQIEEQARNFCYRCAFCLDWKTKNAFTEQQTLDKPSLATATNFHNVPRKTLLLSDKEVLSLSPKMVAKIRRQASR